MTFDLLLALERGVLSRDFLVSVTIEHMSTLCPVCRAELERFLGRPGHGSPLSPLDLLLTLRDGRLGRLQEQEKSAQRDFQELLALPAKKRIARVQRAHRRFRGPALGFLLLEAAAGVIHDSPREAFHLAELAWTVARLSSGWASSLELLALSAAWMANAKRAAGDLESADAWFVYARNLTEKHGVTATPVLAEIDCLEGSLRRAQRRLGEATRLLERAATLFRLAGSTRQLVRALLKQGTVFMERRHVQQAIQRTREALSYLTPEMDPKLYLWGQHNLAQYLSASGDPRAAAEIVAACEPLYEAHAGKNDRLRLSWLQGQIQSGLGELSLAERSFEAARSGFFAQGNGFDASLVSLDLALLYLRQGRHAEVCRLAQEMVGHFEVLGVHREALAALRLFEEAASRAVVTVGLVKKLARFLERSRNDPALRFAPPG